MNRMIRFWLWLLLAGLPLAAQTASQMEAPNRVGVGPVKREMNLSEAIERAIRNNLEVEIERTQRDQAAQAAAGARGFWDPTFRWAPGLETRNLPTGSALQGVEGKLSDHFLRQNFYFRQKLPKAGTQFGLDFENSRESTNNPFAGLTPYINTRLFFSFTQPLLRNREIDQDRARLEISRKQADLSQVQLELKTIDVVTRVQSAYWDLVAARRDVEVEADNVGWAREQLAQNKRMIDAGTLAPVELAASEAELERRLDNWYQAIGQVTTVENVLKTMLSGDAGDPLWNEEIIPTDLKPPKSPPEGIYDLRESISQAQQRRPELRAISTRQSANDIEKRQNANLVKPQVDLVAGYGTTGLGGTLANTTNPFSQSFGELFTRVNQLAALSGLEPVNVGDFGSLPGSVIGGYGTALSTLFGGNFQTAQVGLQLDFTFRNRAAESNLAQSVIAERRLKLERVQAIQTIEAQVRNALQAIQTARQRIAAAEASVRAAREKFESETRLFQTGESTNFLVLTRQNEYADSRRREVLANLGLNRAIALLETALGTTLEDHNIVVK